MRTLAAALLLAAAPAAATPEQDVIAAVNEALNAVNTADAALFERVMLPDAIILAQNYRPDGSVTTRRMTVGDMAVRLRTPGPKVDERIQDPTILVQRDLAHVWTRYTIDIDGKRLHCGVDSFGLAKVNGAWRLTSLTWTAEPQGCPK